MAEPLLHLNDATVVKGGMRVLDRLSLTIHDGEHTAILGPNGAGKTTLVNLLTLEDRPVARPDGEASVLVLGRDRWHVFELRWQLGIVSGSLHQRFASGHSAGPILGEEAVVSGFFATQGFLVNLDVTEGMRDRARDALARVGARHLAGKTVDSMSTGEARRVLIARALVSDPRALVLDEPTAGLDVAARHHVLEMVRTIARAGTTIVLITHHVEEIIPEVSQVVLLDKGRIAASGAPDVVLTSAHLSTIFEASVQVERVDGYYRARVGS